MDQFEKAGVNKELGDKEKSAERFKTELRFLTRQIGDVVGHLEEDLKINYEDLEKQVGQGELQKKIEKDTAIIETLYKITKDALFNLKSERLKEINKEYMEVFESSKSNAEEKEISRQSYLNKLEKLVSDEDFNTTNQRVSQGNLYNLQRQFNMLKPSERAAKGRAKYVGGKTQEEAIENIKTIQDSLRATVEQTGDITDFGLNSLAAACDVIDELIFLYRTKVEIYKEKKEGM